jgi:hypothetical protein
MKGLTTELSPRGTMMDPWGWRARGRWYMEMRMRMHPGFLDEAPCWKHYNCRFLLGKVSETDLVI